MCKVYGSVLMPIPDFILADPVCVPVWTEYDGGEHAIDDAGRKCFVIDACLAPALRALWDAGIKTSGGCCCGHGSGSGVIGVESGMIGVLTDYTHEPGMHLMEAPPYSLVEVVERRRHENEAYNRGRHDGLVQAGREDLALAEQASNDR